MKQLFSFSISLQNLLHSHDDNGNIIALTLCTVFAIVCYQYKRSKRKSPPQPPSPPGLPLVGNLPFLDPELHTYFAELGRKYGPIVKLHLGKTIGIVITTADAAREVLKDHDVIFANRDLPAVAKATSYGPYNIVSAQYGPQWRMLRKVCVVKMLSNATLDSVYGLRRREVRNTVKYFHNRVGHPVNVGEQMFLTILNVITSMLWGGTVEGSERSDLGAEFRQVISDITELLMTPNVSDFFPILAPFDLQGVVRKMKKLSLKFEEIFDRVIDERVKMESEGDDFLGFLLRIKDEGDPKTPLTMMHVKALLMVSFFFMTFALIFLLCS